jgi:hypothetical protein
MSLKKKLSQIKKTSLLPPLVPGKSDDLNALWENVIEPLLPKEDAVRKWHKILMDYVNKPDAVFFIRAFGSHSKKESSEVLRRGFYNTTNYDFSAFYGDNSFPWMFYSLTYDDFVPSDANEFEELMKSKEFPCGCIQTKAEKLYAAYIRGKNPAITTKGYKLAHIYSAGENFNKDSRYSKVSEFCKDVFPRGINTQWSSTGTDIYGTYHHRSVFIDSKEKADEARKFLVAHFLRAVHPLNYFLVPKENSIEWIDEFGDKRHEIGEYPDLVKYVGHKIREKYSQGDNIYQEFLDLIYPCEYHTDAVDNKIIKANYKLDGWKTPTAKSKPVSKKASSHVTKTSSLSKVATTPEIVFIPSNEALFKTNLIKAKKAEIIYEYFDGEVIKKEWDAQEITVNSNVKGNIRSKKFYRDNQAKIFKITVIIRN